MQTANQRIVKQGTIDEGDSKLNQVTVIIPAFNEEQSLPLAIGFGTAISAITPCCALLEQLR